MLTFAYPKILFFLLLIPLFTLLFIVMRRQRKADLKKFGKATSLAGLTPLVSDYKPIVKFCLEMAALAMIVIAMARPWGGVKNQDTTKEGIEVVIAVDASNSMLASATDSEQGISRMNMAKLALERLIDRLDNDRVGLIVYAGDAYTLIPVTNDYVSAKMFLNSIDPSTLQIQGTDMGAAIELATASFSKSKDIGKAIILITDAEELEDSDNVRAAVEDASKNKIQVDVVGVGSTTPMPVSVGGAPIINPETGDPVRTMLNEDLALEIAKIGKGLYVNASNKDAVGELEKQLDKLHKSTLESSFMAVHDELYIIFVWIAFLLIIADIFVLDSKIMRFNKFKFFKRNTKIVGFLIFLSVAGMPVAYAQKQTNTASQSAKPKGATEKERNLIIDGNKLFRSKNYKDAMGKYGEAYKMFPGSNVAAFNLAMSNIYLAATLKDNDSIAQQMINHAADLLRGVAQKEAKYNNISSKAYYNLGNLAFGGEDYAGAVNMYKAALRLNPSDNDARRNLKIAQDKLKNNKDKNKQNQQQNQQQNPQQNQQQNQQNQPQPKEQKMNNQTSDQILNSIERKENQTRAQKLRTQPGQRSRSNKNW